MSFLVSVDPGNITRREAERIARKVNGRKGLKLRIGKTKFLWLFQLPPVFYIDGVHDFLKDEADWDGPTWKLTIEGSYALADLIEELWSHLRRDFVFEATWVGDQPEKTARLNVSELLGLIRACRIGIKTQYLVTGPIAGQAAE